MILAVTAFYFAPHGRAHNFPTYLIAIVVLMTPTFWRTIDNFWHNKTLRIATLLLGYLALSTFWSPEWNQREVISRFGDFGLIVTFLAALSICYQHDDRFFPWLCASLVFIAAVTAGLSLYHFVVMNGPDVLTLTTTRLSGWGGRLDNEVIAGLAYATAAQLSVAMAVTVPRRLPALLYWLVFAFLAYVVALTQSRGPLLALAFGVVVLLLIRYTRLKTALVLPTLLLVIAGVTAFLYTATKSELTPADFSPVELQDRIVNENPHLDILAPDGRPYGVKAAYGGDRKENIKSTGDGVLILSNERDTTIGAVWPAFGIEAGAKYFISVRVRASQETDAGFALRVEEFDSPVLEGSHVATHADRSEEGVVEATRQVIGLIEDWGLTKDWQEFILEYNPTLTARWASILVLNGHEMGNAKLYVDRLTVYQFDKGLTDLNLQRPEHAGHFLLRGIDPRDLIWTKALDQSLNSWPLLGSGIAYSGGITARDGLTYDHPHSIYLSTLNYGGLVGLALLLILVFSLNDDIKKLVPSREHTIAVGMLVFGLTALSMDGDRVLTKVDHLWLALWLPVGLIIALVTSQYR